MQPTGSSCTSMFFGCLGGVGTSQGWLGCNPSHSPWRKTNRSQNRSRHVKLHSAASWHLLNMVIPTCSNTFEDFQYQLNPSRIRMNSDAAMLKKPTSNINPHQHQSYQWLDTADSWDHHSGPTSKLSFSSTFASSAILQKALPTGADRSWKAYVQCWGVTLFLLALPTICPTAGNSKLKRMWHFYNIYIYRYI